MSEAFEAIGESRYSGSSGISPRSISGFSAHADESELLDWLARFAAGKKPGDAGYPKRVFLVHGDPAATILFVGYQGEGTLGAHLQAGAKEVKLDGQIREVKCQIRSISGFSAHADESELLDWLARFAAGKKPGDAGYPKRVFLVHGDPEAQIALEPKVRALGFATHVPHWHEHQTLD